MFKNILVPLDGSRFSESALPYALTIARRAEGRLHLARVHVPVYLDGIQVEAEHLQEIVYEQEQAQMDALAGRLRDSSKVPIEAKLLEGGIVDNLISHCARTKADLMVMTTHGRGPMSRFWMGSVVDELMRRTIVPLLLVRPTAGKLDPTRSVELSRMSIALDGSALAEQILEPALELSRLMGAECTLLRVVVPTRLMGYHAEGFAVAGLDIESQDQQLKAAEDYLAGVVERLGQCGVVLHTQVLASASIAGAILESSQAKPAPVIALGTHGRGGLARLLLGSVADKVVRGADVPVLVRKTTLCL